MTMIEKPSLFDDPLPAAPAARMSDPATSHEAAGIGDRARQRWLVLERFAHLSDSVLLGFTDEELHRACRPFIENAGSVEKRRLELERNLDRDGDALGPPLVEKVVVDGVLLKRPGGSGAPRQVYRITAAGRALVARRRREGLGEHRSEVPGE